MNELKNKLERTMHELYVKSYSEDVYVCLEIDSDRFRNYLFRDWRFNMFYLCNCADKKIKISKEEYIKDRMDLWWNFVKMEILNIPEELYPTEGIYLDVPYPFRFEILQDSFWGDVPSYEDFKMNTNAKFLRRLNKMFNNLTEEQIWEKEIRELRFRINIIDERKNKERAEHKLNKIIAKYDKNNGLIKTYNSRKECCEAEGISKVSLSNHLSGRRKKLKGYTYKEIYA